MATEVGRLHAIFDLDARPFDRGLRGVETKVRLVTGVMNSLGLQSTGLGSVFGTLGTRIQGVSTLASGLGGSLGALGIGIGAVTGAALGLGVALFTLVKSSARAGGELFDLSQKTSFMVETLSGLSIIAKTTGSDINSISPSLIIFQKNMGAAQDATSKQGRLFRSLSIDTRDNEKALRQAFTALAKYGDTQKATELATRLFGRSGAAVLAMIKETNGNLDKAIEKYAKMGLIIGTGAATASDKFNDVLEETTLQLQAVTRSIGMELLPVATDALQSISASLRANKDEWAAWGTSISNVMRGLSVAVHSELGQMLGRITAFSVKWLSLTGLIVQGLGALGSSVEKPGEDFFGPGGAARGGRKTLPGTPEFLAAQRRLAGLKGDGIGGGGGGKGGGGGADPAQTAQRMAELQLTAIVNGLRAEQDANRRALELRRQDFNEYATQYMVIENRRHKAVIDGLDAEQKAAEKLKKGRDVALLEIKNKRTEENTTHEQNRNRVLDERGKIVDQINKFLRDQEREISGLTSATDQWDHAYQQLIDTLKEEGVTLEANTQKRIEANVAMLKEIDLVKQQIRVRQVLRDLTRERFETRAGKERPPWIDLGGGSTVGGEAGTTTRPRIATVDQQVMREQMAKIREQMHRLAGDLTSVFSQSISDGFNQGVNAGLQTLAQGLLRIVEDIFLRRMAKGLEDMLSGISGGGGGGSWFAKIGIPLISSIFGGIGSVGGAGSAAAGAIGRASGGPVWPGNVYKVHKDEVIVPSVPGMVIPKGEGGQKIVNNHYTIQLPPTPKGGYSSPKSERQKAEALMAYVRGTQV